MANEETHTNKTTQPEEYREDNVAERQRESVESMPQEDQDQATELREEAARNAAADRAASPQPKDNLEEEDQHDEDKLGLDADA